jgi:hypothetical protein
VILYLLISALFKSFATLCWLSRRCRYTSAACWSRAVTVALRHGQQLDLLTDRLRLLLGLVVNNAILLVYCARDAEREGMSRRDAVEAPCARD